MRVEVGRRGRPLDGRLLVATNKERNWISTHIVAEAEEEDRQSKAAMARSSTKGMGLCPWSLCFGSIGVFGPLSRSIIMMGGW
jgi:hypothetical protein